jgi:hypothetical protein
LRVLNLTKLKMDSHNDEQTKGAENLETIKLDENGSSS